jgi:7-cyano-7-deazaguanine synthase
MIDIETNDHPEHPNTRPVDSVAVVSGGMDSVTMLHIMAKTMNRRPLVLSFNYGQKHKKELTFAKLHADELGLPHKIVDLSSVTELLTNSALVGKDEVPEGHYADENMKATVVPNRNMMMISIAAAAMINHEGDMLGVGVHAGDHPIYPDCRVEFLESICHTLGVANEGFIPETWQLFAPFQVMGKHHIVAVGDGIGVNYGMTWSCYKGREKHCGACGTCVERKEAFELAKVNDPTSYETDEHDAQVGS